MDLDYREIGRNIRYYRLKKGLNQRDLAERVHVSNQHISHIENAHTKLGLPTLVAIAADGLDKIGFVDEVLRSIGGI